MSTEVGGRRLRRVVLPMREWLSDMAAADVDLEIGRAVDGGVLGVVHLSGYPRVDNPLNLVVRVVGVIVNSTRREGVERVARFWGREMTLPDRAVSAVLIQPPDITDRSHEGVASVRVHFTSRLGAEYEGVVSVLRGVDGVDYVVQCLYPVDLRDELFDYAHRELISSIRFDGD